MWKAVHWPDQQESEGEGEAGYVDKNVEATGRHFNLPGHRKWDLKVTVLEKIHSKEVWMREEIESEHIRKSNSYYKGINLQP